MTLNDEKATEELLSRGVGEFIDPENEFRRKLESNPRSVIIKLGVDPSRPDIHLGHAVVLRKLRKFQDLGCKVVFLVGDYTAQIGDPTGKSKVRPDLEQAEVEKNAKTFIDQVGKILRTDEAVFSWIRNSDWYYGPTDLAPDPATKSIDLEIVRNDSGREKISFSPQSFVGKALFFENTRMQKTHLRKDKIVSITLRGLLWTLKHITHGRLVGRDMFQERISKGEELHMHEMLYPILQGVDSFVIANIYGSCDLEVGGTDQTFNMLIGRDIMKANGVAPQAVLSLELLEGLDGKEKMSKSLDNYVAITDEPGDMFGKVMSLPDSLLEKYFILCTYTPLPDIEKIKKDLENGKLHPKDAKMRLAREVVEIYHGRDAAALASENFEKTFSRREIPEAPEVKVKINSLLSEALLSQAVSSKGEFKRLVDEGAIEILEKNEIINDYSFEIKEPMTVRVGKKRFIKIILE